MADPTVLILEKEVLATSVEVWDCNVLSKMGTVLPAYERHFCFL